MPDALDTALLNFTTSSSSIIHRRQVIHYVFKPYPFFIAALLCIVFVSCDTNRKPESTTQSPSSRTGDGQSFDTKLIANPLKPVDRSSPAATLQSFLENSLSRRVCLEARDFLGFYPLNREVLMVIPVLPYTGVSHDVDYLAFLCRENLLFTFHK